MGSSVAAEESTNPWWAAFESTALSRLVEQGVTSHPDPVKAMAEIRSARAIAERVAAGGAPRADLNMALRGGREKTMYTDRQEGAIDPVAGAVRLSWELDLFGRVKHASKAATAWKEMSVAELQGVRLILGTEIARQAIKRSSTRLANAMRSR